MKKDVNSLLPIGTVILANGGQKKVMIIGLLPTDKNIQYDYIAVLYPEGYVDDKHFYMFNHSDIKEICMEAPDTDESKSFRQRLHDYVNN